MAQEEMVAKVTVRGKTYELRPRGFSALEAKAFREATGMGLGQAFVNIYEPDILAGLVWLHRRRTEKRLTYEDVAEQMTVDDVLDSILADDEDDEGDADPET